VRDQILRGYELLNARDRAAFEDHVRTYFAPDIEVVGPDGIKDLAGALTGWLALLDAFEDLTFDLLTVTRATRGSCWSTCSTGRIPAR
jgi:hypothetical protein